MTKHVAWIAQHPTVTLASYRCCLCGGYVRNGVSLPDASYDFCSSNYVCWCAYLLLKTLARHDRATARYEDVASMSHDAVCAMLVACRDEVEQVETVLPEDWCYIESQVRRLEQVA